MLGEQPFVMLLRAGTVYYELTGFMTHLWPCAVCPTQTSLGLHHKHCV